MATHTYTLQAVKSAAINGLDRNTNFSTATVEELTVAGKSLLVAFQPPTAVALAGKIITDIKLHIYVTTERVDSARETINVYVRLHSDFAENTITYNTRDLGGMATGYDVIRTANVPGNFAIGVTNNTTTDINILTKLTTGLQIALATNESVVSLVGIVTTRGTTPPYITVTAVDTVPSATPKTPKNSYENTDGVITLQWNYVNAGGGSQKSYVIQYKDLDHTEWTELTSATSAITEYEVEADFFSAGEVQWRVKAVSEYDIEGEWSAAATFAAQGAPLAPTITVDINPRPKITWTGLRQQAYEVRIGSDKHKFFGTAQAYNVKEYLPDGNITVGVRIQNEFGLWSAWSLETITIANTPGDSIALTVQAMDKAHLSWTDTTHTTYYVYRDDVAIAKVPGTTYTDHVAIGRHTYKVRGVDGDNYSMSNEVTCTLRVDYPMIAALNALTWLKLKHTASQERAIGMSVSQDVTFQYYSGRSLPLAESGGRVAKSHSFSVAFESPADAAAFEALLGKTVVYKDHHNRLFVGPLMAYESSTGIFFAEYSCTIMQTDNREAVDYD